MQHFSASSFFLGVGRRVTVFEVSFSQASRKVEFFSWRRLNYFFLLVFAHLRVVQWFVWALYRVRFVLSFCLFVFPLMGKAEWGGTPVCWWLGLYFCFELYQTFREELMPILLKLFQKLQKEEHFQIHSTRPPSPQYQNQTKTTHKKENYRPISLMNIDAKILYKILANRIQQHIRKLIHCDQAVFIPGM